MIPNLQGLKHKPDMLKLGEGIPVQQLGSVSYYIFLFLSLVTAVNQEVRTMLSVIGVL